MLTASTETSKRSTKGKQRATEDHSSSSSEGAQMEVDDRGARAISGDSPVQRRVKDLLETAGESDAEGDRLTSEVYFKRIDREVTTVPGCQTWTTGSKEINRSAGRAKL